MTDLTIRDKETGLPDYDWVKYVVTEAGRVTVQLNQAAGADLEMHLYVQQGSNLVRLGGGILAAGDAQAGQVVFIEVHGRNIARGVMGRGDYTLAVTLS